MPIQFITAQDLAKHLAGQNDWLILDASYYLDGGAAKGEALYQQKAIPGAKFWDIDACGDPFSTLPHMLGPSSIFATYLEAFGYEPGQSICIYDQQGLFSSPRLAWEFAARGFDDFVHILEGGLPAWQQKGFPIGEGSTTADLTPAEAMVSGIASPSVASLDEVLDAIDRGLQIADARSPGRFAGTEPDPRPGLRSGHIPGSVNIPYSTIVRHGRFINDFDLAGLDLSKPIITTCGSGITAAGLALALEMRGAEQVSLYDGSWAEWGDQRSMTPVEIGLASAP